MLIIAFITLGFTSKESEKNSWFYVGEDEEIIYTVPTQDESQYVNLELPYTGKSYTGFKQAIAIRESQGQYKLITLLDTWENTNLVCRPCVLLGLRVKKIF